MAARTLVNGACILLLASGCAAEGRPAQQELDEEVRTSEAELSFREQCASVDRDALMEGFGTVFGTTRNYDHAGCRHAFVIDFVNNDTDGGTGGQPDFTWNEALPDNQVDCERASILVYSWDSDLNGNPLEAKSASGFWIAGFGGICGGLDVWMTPAREDEVTRYAVSARQGLANGNYSKRKVKASFF